MNENECFITRVAIKAYQKYLKEEKRIGEKETKDRQRRKANLVARQKKIAHQMKRTKLRRKGNRT
jgi:hypothetical protein